MLAAAEARRPFDLSRGPLLRATLLRLGPQRHVLLLCLHHIVFDGWSLGLLIREATALYEAYLRGEESPLEELAVQYVDYAVWQRERFESGGMAQQLEYWKEQLRGPLPVLELGRVRPVLPSSRGAEEEFEIGEGLREGLNELSRREGATMFMVLLSAFVVLLHRYTGETDIVVGTPVAGRIRAEVEPLIGFFVNTLVLRLKVSENPTFRELLARVREVCLDGYANQEVPFEKVVEAVRPERATSHTPLFQVMFALQNAPIPSLELPQVSLRPAKIEGAVAKFDLSFNMVETTNRLAGVIEYGTDLFDRETIVRMTGHFTTLLQSIVQKPEQRLAHLSLLSEGEKRQLESWNKTGADYAQSHLIHELFEAQVKRTPRAIAVRFEDEQLTYEELNERSNQLAHYLQAHGVEPETLVGIYMERSLEMVVGLFGVLKAGGAYLPLDPTYPTARLARMMENAQAPIILTQQHLFGELLQQGARVVCLDSEWPTIAAYETHNACSQVAEDNLAYVIYTSGSTGQPKGAMNTHRGVCNRLCWIQETNGLDETDAVLQKTPFSFDVSVWEFFWPLMCGARLVLAAPEAHRDSAYLTQIIRQQQITTLHFVPSMLEAFLDEGALEECPGLKRVFCSGEALPYEYLESFMERSSAALFNLYGPTETAIEVTHWTCRKDDDGRRVPIGKPIANIQIHLLDAALELVPVNVPGELHIGGVGVGRGYYRQPALTAERFIPDALSSVPGARQYKSGDLARYLPDGQIEYLGCLDDQVKIRGYRIELGEIEAALNQHPEVRETVVIARKENGRPTLAAYIAVNVDAAPTAAQLHGYLRNLVPIYMVPSNFVLLNELPLTPNGKVDKRALPPPKPTQSDDENTFVEPCTATEHALARIWKDILELERVGVHDDFFALGGHSLSAVKVISRVRTDFQIELPLRRLFETPTIVALGEVIETAQADSRPMVVSPLVRHSRDQFRVTVPRIQ